MSDEKPRAPKDPASWNDRYTDGALPWDTGVPDSHLSDVLDDYSISPGPALEVGCGTGTNVIWLAKHGFQVTGIDLSPVAIKRAKAKVAHAGVDSRLLSGDFLVTQIRGGPFEFVYDRGCFHVFGEAADRARYAERVAGLLSPEGIWHSLIGSTDGPPRDSGPPRHSALDIAKAVEPHFEILELRSTVFDSLQHGDKRAWLLVARRRTTYPEA